MSRRKNYYQVLQEELRCADRQPPSGKTREQLEDGIALINATLAGPCDNAERIGLCADRRRMQNELAAMGGKK
jgi:hypothetical protein